MTAIWKDGRYGVPLASISWSTEQTIACIRDYYQFICKMYVRHAAVEYPPPGGWPQITNERAKALGKSEEVAALLRQLPYIVHRGTSMCTTPCAPYTWFQDWRQDFANMTEDFSSDDADDIKLLTEGFSACENTPPHVVGLTTAGRDDDIYLIDIKHGILYWIGCPTGLDMAHECDRILEYPDEWAPENEVEWREEGSAFFIPRFFELQKQKFRDLHYVPTHGLKILHASTNNPEGQKRVSMLQGIWREHGWPDAEDFDKEKCLAAIEKAMEEKFPDYFVSEYLPPEPLRASL